MSAQLANEISTLKEMEEELRLEILEASHNVFAVMGSMVDAISEATLLERAAGQGDWKEEERRLAEAQERKRELMQEHSRVEQQRKNAETVVQVMGASGANRHGGNGQ